MFATYWALIGLMAALLINRAADCWLSPSRLQCGFTRHPARQWSVTIGVPVLFAIQAILAKGDSALWTACLFSAVFVLLGILDLEQRRMPNVVLMPALGAALLTGFLLNRPAQTVAGVMVSFVVFFVLYWVGRRLFGRGALGAGDVKLAALVGAVLGLAYAPLALLLGIITAGAVSAVLLVTRTARLGDTIPYGSCLTLSAVVALIWATASTAA